MNDWHDRQALARPPSWSNPADPPQRGAFCSTCGGQRFWIERENTRVKPAVKPKGWRCSTCHPPVEAAGAINVLSCS